MLADKDISKQQARQNSTDSKVILNVRVIYSPAFSVRFRLLSHACHVTVLTDAQGSACPCLRPAITSSRMLTALHFTTTGVFITKDFLKTVHSNFSAVHF